MSKQRVLIVDDEEHIVELIKFNLEALKYRVITANDGITALKIAKEEKPDLVLLDLMIPGMDGEEVCTEIRKDLEISTMPIIMISAKSEEFDTILGLELGADDYITKPFSVRELIARIKAVLRRTGTDPVSNSRVEFGNIVIDYQKREVLKGNNKVVLTLKEFELLQMLIENKGRVLTRDLLLDKIWGYDYIGETRTVDVHIRHLRLKIEDDDKNPVFIETIRGVGYRFNIGDGN